MTRQDPQINIRLPENLKQAIQDAAKANKRSMNAEVVARLEQSLLTKSNDNALIAEIETSLLTVLDAIHDLSKLHPAFQQHQKKIKVNQEDK